MRRMISCLALSILIAGSAAQAKVFKVATIAPDGSSWMRSMGEASDDIAKRTEGRVKFKFFTGGVMGNDRSVMRKVRAGQLDGGMFTLGGLSEANPDLNIYGIPFLFPNFEAIDRTRKELDPKLAEGLLKGGFTTFGFSEGGIARLFSKFPVTSIEGMRGKKMWLPDNESVGQVAMESLGLSPVTLPLTDVLTGLQTGLIEVVANSSLGALALQWSTATTHVTTTPLVYVAGALAIKNSSFEELTPPDRAVVREVMEKTYRYFDRKNREDENKAYQTLLAEGMKPVTPTDAEIVKWRAIAAEVGEKMAAKGQFSAELYHLALKLAGQASGAR